MNSYEFAILYHPDLEVDLSKAEDKVKKIIEGNGGKVVKTDNWGKRKLAYKIKGHEHAVYVFYEEDIAGPSVQKVEATLNITDEIIRFLIVRPDQKAIAKAEAVKAKRKRPEEDREETKADSKEEE